MKECDNRYAFETAYEYLGVHREDTSYIFRVWAPGADAVYVVGDFNGWSESDQMTRLDGGIWECSICADNIREGDLYKYKIKNGSQDLYKADPYSFCSKDAEETASVVADVFGYEWRDKGWLEYRRNCSDNKAINIYKIYATSWRRHDNGNAYSWRELAVELAPYVKQMGYTHVELMPIMEYEGEDLFGYRVDCYYAPSARMGTPYEFMSFIDSMHEAGIGVILDIMPLCFEKKEHSLAEFDGQPLYERYDAEKGEDLLSEIRYFNIERDEVKSFLLSNAHFWISVYHSDGLKFNFDFVNKLSKSEEGNNFLHTLKSIIKKRFPDVLFVDSCEEKLFDDFLGDDSQNFAFIKAKLGYQMTFPCEKVLLMGTEIGQLWESERTPSVKWQLIDHELNAKLQYYVAELNHFYLKESLLWQDKGFEISDTNDRNIMSYKRIDDKGNELIIILNFTFANRKDFRIGVSKKGRYKEVFNSEDRRFGGSDDVKCKIVESESIKCQFFSESIVLNVPPVSLSVFKYAE